MAVTYSTQLCTIIQSLKSYNKVSKIFFKMWYYLIIFLIPGQVYVSKEVLQLTFHSPTQNFTPHYCKMVNNAPIQKWMLSQMYLLACYFVTDIRMLRSDSTQAVTHHWKTLQPGDYVSLAILWELNRMNTWQTKLLCCAHSHMGHWRTGSVNLADQGQRG